MSIKDILVHVDSGAASRARIEIAVQIARKFDAHLIGLYPYQEVNFAGYAGTTVPQSLIEAHLESLRESAQEASKLFGELTRDSGIANEWRSQHSPAPKALKLNARYVDLVICGQDSPDDESWTSESVAEDAVMQCARPVLVVPYIGALHPVGHKVMVAWDGSRESVRAVHDAMPLLTAADHVRVMAINAHPGDQTHGEIPCADICLHLARHGVEAEASAMPSNGGDLGGQFLSLAADDGIDLMVMGAYGHSRFRELVLGGVTRSMLQQMTVPVLMSH